MSYAPALYSNTWSEGLHSIHVKMCCHSLNEPTRQRASTDSHKVTDSAVLTVEMRLVTGGVRLRRAAEPSEPESEETTESTHHEHTHHEHSHSEHHHEHTHTEHHPGHDYNHMKEKFMNELGHLPSKILNIWVNYIMYLLIKTVYIMTNKS